MYTFLLYFSLRFAAALGAVYTCDFPYDLVYDLLPEVCVQQVIFLLVLAVMCKPTIIMGDRKRIGSLFCLHTNRARNRMVICTEIRTRVDGPL
jgi:hypothetical protein